MRVFIIDDHCLFRKSLISMLNSCQGIQVIGEAGKGQVALSKIKELKPDIAVIDIMLPDISGFELARAVLDYLPATKIVFLTACESEDDLKKASEIGAAGYFLKNIEPEEFISYLHDIYQGAQRVSPDIGGKIFAKLKDSRTTSESLDQENKNLLSERELEILQMLRDGLNNKELARRLFISENTVKNHLKSIYSKLGVDNRVQAVIKAVEQHLL
ncbi:response regulator transcription factor [Neomoorella humiferrea]|uniref:response regulator n=1 Tax=Neomoorella humiferrea TaxID=676965 RepID=UPI003D901DAF